MSEKLTGMNGVIVIETESGKEISRVKNTVTKCWEEFIAAMGIDGFYAGMSAIEAGQNFVFSPISQTGNNGLSYYQNSDSLLTIYLLNLSEAEKAALTKDSNNLPVYDSELNIDSSKIVGYATATYTATESKQGYLIPMENTNLINPRRHGLKFKWDTGVLSGTYNAIAIGFNVLKRPYNGMCIYRGLETNNKVLGESSPDGYMIKPGVKNSDGSIVITGENEILLGDSTAVDKGRKILNLATGETTLLSSDDVRYNFPLVKGYYPQLCSGNYFVYSNLSNLFKVDISTKSQTSVGTGTDCFIYNGYIYSKYSNTIYRAYTLDNITYTSSKNLTIANMKIPSEFLESNNGYYFGISSVGNKYLVCYRYNYSTISSYSYPLMKAFICSDPTNIAGSITEMIPFLNTFNGCEILGKKVFFNQVIPHSIAYNNQYTYLNSAGTGSVIVAKNGLKMTTEGLYGNMMSFKVFDENQQIPTGEGLKITYFYTFEQ